VKNLLFCDLVGSADLSNHANGLPVMDARPNPNLANESIHEEHRR
jgi:hypothetical protein